MERVAADGALSVSVDLRVRWVICCTTGEGVTYMVDSCGDHAHRLEHRGVGWSVRVRALLTGFHSTGVATTRTASLRSGMLAPQWRSGAPTYAH
jgi:hypothetical protein